MQEQLTAIIESNKHMEGALLPTLHEVQDLFGYIPAEAVPAIATGLNLSRAEVHGVVSFYEDFRHHKLGQTRISICRAEACQAMGSRQLEAHAKASLGIDYGEITEDGKFSLLPVYCLGNCACSPSVRINNRVYARVSASRFDQLLERARSEDIE